MEKEYHFISRFNIVNSCFNIKRVMLNIGIISLIIALVLELIIGQRFGVVFIIPMLYLVKSRAQVSNKIIYADVPVYIHISESSIAYTFEGVCVTNRFVGSKKFVMDFQNIKNISYSEAKQIAFIQYDGYLEYLNADNDVIKKEKKINDKLELYIPNDKWNDIIEMHNKIWNKCL